MKPLQKRLTPLLYGLALCLPLGLKLGIPLVLVQGERLGLFADHSGAVTSSAVYTVNEIHGFLLTAHQLGQPLVHFQLAGLVEPDERWHDEATGILSMLIEASHNHVTVTLLAPGPAESLPLALVQLPTGTYLQQILLSDGVAELDDAQLEQIPKDISTSLQQAQTSAQGQYKNVWATRSSEVHYDSEE